jgi:hypothetical protein
VVEVRLKLALFKTLNRRALKECVGKPPNAGFQGSAAGLHGSARNQHGMGRRWEGEAFVQKLVYVKIR